MRYTFGNTSDAAERLRNIAGFFNPLAAEFISQQLNGPVRSAADLGCGPGYTTQMLASATKACQVTGLDFSDYFIELAQQHFPELYFVKQDLIKWNSSDKFDILYCRFLLSHLVNLRQVLESWILHLNPGGMLLIDELEDIHTDVPVFNEYLTMNNTLIQSQGAELFVGKKLNYEVNGFNVLLNECDVIPVKDSQAAGWFYPNAVGIWNEEEVVLSTLSEKQRKKISDELLEISNNASNKTNITWKMKRIILTN